MAESITGGDVKNIVELEADVNVEFNEAASRQQINSGESVKTLFGKLKKFLTDLKAVAFSGAYSDLSGAPDLTEYATKAELDTKAEKELYGNYGINLGRLAGSTVGFLSSTMGRANAATGGYSFSQGFDNTASGVASFAGGQSSAAEGENALAHGYFVKTTKNNEKAFGAYNKSSTDTIFSVGDGTADDARHNAFEITTTGGKLHDKDIAVKDDIPTSLPASGGNADTLGGLPAATFMRYETPTQLLTSINDMVTTGTYGVFYATPDFPTGYGTWGFLEVRRFGSICYQTIIFDTGKVITRAITIAENYNTWTEWHEPYTNIDKPYISGSATVAANGTTCTSNHGFTPSAVIWWDGSLSGVAVSFSDTQFTIDKTSSVDRTINYLIFK